MARSEDQVGANPNLIPSMSDLKAALSDKVISRLPLSDIRNALIAKGMLYSPAHGDTAFTVPLFDGFMKRIMPAL